MDPRSIHYLAAACGGRLVQSGAGGMVSRVCTDSRKAQPGDLFFALSGDHFDGHAFVEEVAAKRVAGVVIQAGRGSELPASCGVIEVEDVRRALGALARRYRQDFHPHCVAVAGSNGKTTTKELVAAVLRQRYNTVWSEASFNNDIGVPVTLLRLAEGTQAAVFELGTNHPGELAPLIEMVKPRLGLITSIGREHLEFFKDLEGVVEEEGTLSAQLPKDGVLILNGDSEWAEVLARRGCCRVVRVGLQAGMSWRASQVSLSSAGTRFTIEDGPTEYRGEYSLALLGRHQVTNALLAIATGFELGLGADEIRRGLSECRPAKSRLVLKECRGIAILDDSYNANADSMVAALHTLHELPCAGRRVAVIGDMGELGESAAAAHHEVGRTAGDLGIDFVVTVGAQSRLTLDSARRTGSTQGVEFATPEEVIQHLRSFLRPGDIVLLKASRSAGLDRISEALSQ